LHRLPAQPELDKFRYWERRTHARVYRAQHPVDVWGRISSRKIPKKLSFVWARRNVAGVWYKDKRRNSKYRLQLWPRLRGDADQQQWSVLRKKKNTKSFPK